MLELLYAAACVPLFGVALDCFARYARRRAWSGAGAAWFLLGVALLALAIDAFRALLLATLRAPNDLVVLLILTLVGGAACYALLRSWKQLAKPAGGAREGSAPPRTTASAT